MKNFKLRLAICFFLSFLFAANKAKANPGDSCNSAYVLTSDACQDSVKLVDSVTWFSFTATSTMLQIRIYNPSDSMIARVIGAELYSGTCGSLVSYPVGVEETKSMIDTLRDSLIIFGVSGMMPGNTYYFKTLAIPETDSTLFNTRFFKICDFFSPLTSCVGPGFCEYVSNGDFGQFTPPSLASTWTINTVSGSWPLSSFFPVDCWNAIMCPDYYNASAPLASGVSIPSNDMDNYYTSNLVYDQTNPGCTSGDCGYAGFIAYNTPHTYTNRGLCTGVYTCWREYVEQPLAHPLQAGVTYNVSFWISLASQSVYYVAPQNVGIVFTQSDPSIQGSMTAGYDIGCSYGPLLYNGNPLTPNITASASSQVDGSMGIGTWQQITGTFTPSISGTYYIIIGNFYDDSPGNTPYTATGYNVTYSTGDGDSYYYLDDVSITSNLSATITPNPAIICSAYASSATLTVTVSGGSSPYTYNWTTGASTSTITVSPPGTNIYNVYITDATGCTIMTSTTVIVDNLKIPHPVGVNVCQNGCVNLLAPPLGGTAPYTYSWGGDPTWFTTPTNIANPQICPPAGTLPGLYNFFEVVQDANGCFANVLVTVNVLASPSVPTIIGQKYNCSRFNIYSVSPVDPLATYTWATSGFPPAGTGTSTGPTILPSYGGYVSFTATYTDGCSSTGYFFVQPCCTDASFDVNFGTVTIGSPSSYTDQSIIINGILTIASIVNFTGCDVQFTPGSSIDILNGGILNLNPSNINCTHLHAGCEEMWDGIYLEQGGLLNATSIQGAVLIEDAKNAVVVNSAPNPGIFNLNQVVFNKDYQDIVVESTGVIYAGSAINCVFTCRELSALPSICNAYTDWDNDVLYPATTISLVPHFGDITWTGMYLNRVNTYSNFTGCYFDNMDTGVYATQGNLGVYGNTFQNIRASGSSAGVVAKNCLYCPYYNSLVVGGPAASQSNTFTNCTIGVEAGYLNYVTIAYNSFSNPLHYPFIYAIDQGERSLFGGTGSVSIHNNNIFNALIGIRVFSNLNTTGDIYCNTINDPTCNYYSYTGITVTEVAQPINAYYHVENNFINSPTNGIIVNNTYNTNILSNPINLGFGVSRVCSYSSTGVGILANGCDEASVFCDNQITGSLPVSANNYTGMEESQSTNTVFWSNSSSDLNQHILFDGTTYTGDNAYSNLLYNGNTGIITASFALSFQSIYGNNTPGDDAHNLFYGLTCEVNFLASLFVTYFYFGSDMPTSCPPLGNSLGPAWGETKCSYFCPAQIPMSMEHSIINDTNPLMSLIMDSVIMIKDTIILDSSTVAYMHGIVLNRDSFPDIHDTAIAQAKEGVLRVLWHNQYLLTSDAILKRFNDSMHHTPMGLILAIDSSINSSTTIVQFNALLSNLNSITPVNNIEANLQLATWGYLTYLVNGSLSNAQIAVVRVLANKCPDWDGDAVYEARALCSIYDTVGTAYKDSCYRHSHKPEKPKQNTSLGSALTNTFSLFPNPNNGGFTLAYQLEKGQIGEINIYDMFGKKVAYYQLDASTEKKNINASALDNGVYLYSISVKNSIVKQGKLVIIK